jgi:hypothetical protein
MKLYHLTPKDNLDSITKDGLRAGTYLTSEHELGEYYAETIEDEDQEAVWLCLDLEKLDKTSFAPDFPSLEEPILTVLRDRNDYPSEFDEDDLWQEWENTNKTWQNCLDLVGSVRYMNIIPPKLLFVMDADESLKPLQKQNVTKTEVKEKKKNKLSI